MQDELYLRQQAERCLRLAEVCSPKVAQMLRGFAADYLERAGRAATRACLEPPEPSGRTPDTTIRLRSS